MASAAAARNRGNPSGSGSTDRSTASVLPGHAIFQKSEHVLEFCPVAFVDRHQVFVCLQHMASVLEFRAIRRTRQRRGVLAKTHRKIPRIHGEQPVQTEISDQLEITLAE